ncbi:S8 family peptidase [Frankia sp. AiPs1]|uniref:S8 family peptidase n=1 Tax=Frankia sp. AiPs1 TaxID=573493 RepID=UPI00204497C8|nr:S8 family peptidase [Frankia sp. AiPs1]MCM3921330.1 S8 family peptidase [Frankia sp. AiPs1]
MNRRLFKLAASGGLITAFALAQPFATGAATAASPADPTTTPAASAAPAAAAAAEAEAAGQYIVVLKSLPPSNGGTAPAVGRARARGVQVRREYQNTVSGYTARLDAAQLATARADPDVDYIEPDVVVHADGVQRRPDWGLDRLDQRNRPLDEKYKYDSTGARVTAYVIDSGIRTTHQEFGGRASGGYSAVDDGNGTNDCNGHGTHVAGTIGGTTYGVAKLAHLVAVRVLDCNGFGTLSGVINAVDWVTSNRTRPAVANISIESTPSRALDQALRQSIAAGIVYSVSAGNGDTDACDVSPARVPRAITVGSTTLTDSRNPTSNYGRCVDVFAPGTDITSAGISSDTATAVDSGTSMAAPHVAGVAAIYLGTHPTAAPDRVRDAIVRDATPGLLTDIGAGSQNALLYSGSSGSSGSAIG